MDNTKIIAKYIDGEMSAEEESQFLKDVEQDNNLREELQLQNNLIKNLKRERNDILRVELQSYSKERSKQKLRYFSIAASAVLVIGSCLGLLFQDYQDKDLFLTFYEPYPNILNSRGISPVSEVLQAYTEMDYDKVINNISERDYQSDTIKFYLGLSQIETGSYEAAKQTLLQIPKSSIFYQQRTWYLGLICLRQDETEQGKKYFEEIEKYQFQFKAAQEILAELD